MHFRKMHFSKNFKFCKFLAGSFSAVSKRNFARKYAFDSIFQALQHLHPSASLQSQNFRKKSIWKISNFCEIKSFQTNIYLQHLALIQPRTGLSTFARLLKFAKLGNSCTRIVARASNPNSWPKIQWTRCTKSTVTQGSRALQTGSFPDPHLSEVTELYLNPLHTNNSSSMLPHGHEYVRRFLNLFGPK